MCVYKSAVCISPFNYHVWLSPTTFAVSPSSKAKLVYFNIKTFIEMFMFSYFPEIKFLSVICVHFPPPLLLAPFTCFKAIFTMIINFPAFAIFHVEFRMNSGWIAQLDFYVHPSKSLYLDTCKVMLAAWDNNTHACTPLYVVFHINENPQTNLWQKL